MQDTIQRSPGINIKKDRTTELWNLPINPIKNPSEMTSMQNRNLQFRPHQQVPHSSSNVHILPYLQNRVKYMHQTFFCPPHSNLLVAINNHHLKGCPFMTADTVRKYLPISPATSKFRMKRPCTVIQITRSKPPQSHCAPLRHKAPRINETIPTTIPCEDGYSDGHVNNIFYLSALSDSRTRGQNDKN